MAMIGSGRIPSMPAAPAKPNWIGILADALAGLSGSGPVYAPMAERRREEKAAYDHEQQQYAQRRADEQSDSDLSYQRSRDLIDYKRAHPDDQLTQYLDAAGIRDPAERAKIYRQKVDALTAPPMMSAQGYDEQGNPVLRFFPRAPTATAPATSGPPVGTVKGGYRFKGGDPAQPSSWESVGGPTQPASATFP
jgi:hypothetical protein